jgi:hypothetical protein
VEFLTDPTKVLKALEQEGLYELQMKLSENKQGGVFLSSA